MEKNSEENETFPYIFPIEPVRALIEIRSKTQIRLYDYAYPRVSC